MLFFCNLSILFLDHHNHYIGNCLLSVAMELLIKGLGDAMVYTPTNPTYAIRIDSEHTPLEPCFDLHDSGLYTIRQYVFDDRTPQEGDGRLLDDGTAQQLLTDFRERGLSQDTLLVHCIMGKNRSPAVGMALNDIFRLGYDSSQLKERYPAANNYIYETLMSVARRFL